MPMPPVSIYELTSMRSDIALAACDQSCVVSRKTTAPDGMGSGADTYTVINTTVAGLQTPSATDLQNYAEMISAKETWTVNFPYGTDIQRQDHLLIGGFILEVQAKLSPQSYDTLTTVLASTIEP
jgi:hypothetical protein